MFEDQCTAHRLVCLAVLDSDPRADLKKGMVNSAGVIPISSQIACDVLLPR